MFSNIHMIAANSLNTMYNAFPSASAEPRRFTNLIIIITPLMFSAQN